MTCWPEEGGLLPIAVTICAETLAYRCTGKPDEWTLVILAKHRDSEELPYGMIEFMTRLANGKLESKELKAYKEMQPPLSFK